MALLGRDNSEDLNYSEESQPLTSPGATEDDLNISHDDSDDIAQAPRFSHVVDIHGDQLRAQERQRKEVFNDDVEKMFELPKKFDISSLISGSPAVVSEQQSPEHVSTAQGETRLYREEDYTSGLSVEMSSMGHRRDSFPHIHHPLKALRSSRSCKSVRDDKPKKKKKKKKKKRKMHTVKSFPSRSATLSPSIPEVEVEEYEISPAGSSSSSMSSDDFDDYRVGDEIDSMLLVPAQHQSEASPKGQRTPQPSNDDFKVGFYIGDRATSPIHEVDKQKKDETTVKATSPNKIFYVGDYADEPQLSPPATLDRHQSDYGVSYEEPKHSVKFSIGAEDSIPTLKSDTSLESQGDGTNQPLHASSRSEPRIQKHRHKHHNHDPFKHEDLLLRRQIGSEVKMEDYLKHVPTETEEAILLQKADLDDMTSHRLENVRGIRRHKIAKHNAVASIVHIGKSDRGKKKPTFKRKKIDHSPHEVFVELDELYLGENDYEWREKARWIKFEEDVEEGAERWGKPHVASLSFHSLLELRRGLESGCLLLDLDASDLPTIVNSVIDTMIIHDQLRPENKGNVLRTLLLKHRHVGEGVKSLIRRNISYMNLRAMGLDNKNRHQGNKLSLIKSFSSASFGKSSSSNSIPMLERRDNKADKVNGKGMKFEAKDLQFVKVDVDNNMTDGVHIGITTPESTQRNIRDITRRIPKGAEAITVLVGSVDYLDTPTMAFVRLAEGQILENLTEVPLPVRFLFILLGPEETSMDYHEVGRSISTLMSNQDFHDVAYRAESRGEILHAINQFLDESIVLPPGDWDQKTLLPIAEMNKKRARQRKRKKQKEEEKKALLKKVEAEKIPSDPLKRTGCIFGGLINDVRRRYPYYISDFTDALNVQCVAAFVFIFFACFAPCIAFGGLLEEKTGGYMGVTETVVSTSLCGIIFGLFAGQPLMIVGATGPVLVFEQSLYKFCKSNSIEFLTMRVWIGFWVMMISAIVVALESSFLVRYITRFTEEIFAILISLIFIFEVIKKLDKTFAYHPLLPLENYCKDFGCKAGNGSVLYNGSLYLYTNTSNANLTSDLVYSHPNSSDHHDDEDDEGHHKYTLPQPNTALMSSILTIGTFLVAHFLKIFRNSKFLGRSARRALGDFGIVISIILMVLLDYSMQDIYTQKLAISNTFEPTSPNKRGWFVHPLGTKKPIQAYIIFASFIPAFLIFILLFLETQITEMILNKKELKMRKGSGFHLDQLLMGMMTFVCALFGLPWMCAATVRTIAHTSALSVMSRTHAPGEKPKLVEVKEQRVTNILMNAMIGVSLTWGPLLQAIPLAVLFGVFLYLGVSSLSGVQMFKRMKLLFIPNKYHPSTSYVRRVKTIKMHLFTVVQVVLLVLLLIVKLSAAALAFPLFVILLIPLRLKLMGYVFTPSELEVLDKEEEDSDCDDEDDPDFYQQAHMPV
ncbi:band 3 anion transport protein-like isoform X2 [Mizuhopecten yessoensis]|uniref:band 3 anion transport protein-like isoform X2 n=1 Tax=Mizuhopecten yessoensis TaxID=6573 RepID=UPI000B45BBAD|nr:band 3 anion transport protein-like isoform X2 [Mizuhopecten yessoensis]